MSAYSHKRTLVRRIPTAGRLAADPRWNPTRPGLDLSVSYGIIDDMGGTNEAVNLNGSAKITITLPAAANGQGKGKREE